MTIEKKQKKWKCKVFYVYTHEEKELLMQMCYDEILNNTREVLDNLDKYPVFSANKRDRPTRKGKKQKTL